MSNTFVNKNYLIPVIKECDTLENALFLLTDITYNMNNDYCSNVYVVNTNSIYFTKKNVIYYIDDKNIIHKPNYNFCNMSLLTHINKYDDFTNNNMCVEFCNSKLEHIVITNNTENINQQKKEQTEDEKNLFKLYNEIMETYNEELRNKTEIEKELKILKSNREKIIKKQKEKLLTNLSKLKNDYKTYVLMKKSLTANPDKEIPYLFSLKFPYFEDLLKNNKNVMDKLENMNLDKTLNNNEELDDDIIKLCNQYGNDIKKLTTKFDHSWTELEIDNDLNDNNNSMFGKI